MGEFLSQHVQHLIGRFSGPLNFRLLIQPLVAAFLGFRAGLRDAREGLPPFGWELLTTRRKNRSQLVQGAWRNIGRLFIAAIIIDVVSEIYVLHWVYPLQALIVATVLAVPTYVAGRGWTNRIARRRIHRQVEGPPRNLR
jgi:hypothetical protein